MNAEFRRQLWLHMSVERLFATPAVIALIVVLAGIVNEWKREPVAALALCLAGVLSGCMGVASAIESLASESRARTWDWQRLSGVGPWKLTWGKLLGSTLHAHYGAGFAYGVFLTVAETDQGRTNPFIVVLLGLALGALMQSAGMLIAAWQIVSQRQQASPAASYVLGAGFSGLMLIVIFSTLEPRYDHAAAGVQWYGLFGAPAMVSLVSALAFLCWSVLASYRLLRNQLEGQFASWLAPAFSAFTACYVAGFVSPPAFGPVRGAASVRLLSAEIVVAGAAYATCLCATMRPVELKRSLLALRTDRRAAWTRTPAWISCVTLSLVFGFFVAAVVGIVDQHAGPAGAISAVLALLVLRDAGLLLALRLRGGPLASDGWLVVFCGCLHGLAPWIADGIGARVLRSFFSLDPSRGWHAAPVVICEILLVVQWVRVLWSRQRREAQGVAAPSPSAR